MKIQLLHNKDCHVREKFLAELQEMGLEPEIILIENDEEAEKYKFAGSTQLLIDGKDIDPMAEKILNYHESGCRIYLWNGNIYEYPPKEMVKTALEKHGG